jgi:hypothetical protein
MHVCGIFGASVQRRLTGLDREIEELGEIEEFVSMGVTSVARL